MATDSFNSAGADASQGILGFLAALDAQKRQKRLDDLTAQQQGFDQHIKLRDIALKESKEQREAEQHKADLAERVSQHASQADQIAGNLQAKKAQQVEKTLGNMGPGDYPDSQLIQDMDAVGMGSLAPKPPVTQQSAPGLVAPNASAVPGGMRVAPAPNEPPAQMGLTGAADPMVRPYVGSPAQRDKIAMRGQQQALIDSLPEGDPRKDEIRQSLQAEAAGLKVPAGFFSKQATGKTRIMFDPIRGVYKDPATGNPITDVPADAAIDRMAEPKDTSAGEAAREQTRANAVNQIREHAYTELNNRAKSTEEQIANLNKLDTSMAQNSNIADSTLAEQIIKITAGGAGSGVRITQPEIDQVLKKSRTVWADLQMKMNRLSSDPKANVFFDADQKRALRDLMGVIRSKANQTHEKIIAARRQVDEASDVPTINRARTSLEEALAAGPTPAAPGPKHTRYDENGKVVE